VSHFQAVADSPYSHPAVNQIRAGYRRAPYYSNSIYYRLDNSEVVIVRILGRQDPATAF
jgi:toxin ParE1/3/4